MKIDKGNLVGTGFQQEKEIIGLSAPSLSPASVIGVTPPADTDKLFSVGFSAGNKQTPPVLKAQDGHKIHRYATGFSGGIQGAQEIIVQDNTEDLRSGKLGLDSVIASLALKLYQQSSHSKLEYVSSVMYREHGAYTREDLDCSDFRDDFLDKIGDKVGGGRVSIDQDFFEAAGFHYASKIQYGAIFVAVIVAKSSKATIYQVNFMSIGVSMPGYTVRSTGEFKTLEDALSAIRERRSAFRQACDVVADQLRIGTDPSRFSVPFISCMPWLSLDKAVDNLAYNKELDDKRIGAFHAKVKHGQYADAVHELAAVVDIKKQAGAVAEYINDDDGIAIQLAYCACQVAELDYEQLFPKAVRTFVAFIADGYGVRLKTLSARQYMYAAKKKDAFKVRDGDVADESFRFIPASDMRAFKVYHPKSGLFWRVSKRWRGSVDYLGSTSDARKAGLFTVAYQGPKFEFEGVSNIVSRKLPGGEVDSLESFGLNQLYDKGGEGQDQHDSASAEIRKSVAGGPSSTWGTPIDGPDMSVSESRGAMHSPDCPPDSDLVDREDSRESFGFYHMLQGTRASVVLFKGGVSGCWRGSGGKESVGVSKHVIKRTSDSASTNDHYSPTRFFAY